MQRVVFLTVYPLVKLVAIMPQRLFYVFSDGIYILLYYFIGYRKKVVESNLLLTFPQKMRRERKSIHKKFYRHFCDVFMEMAKSTTISSSELKTRFILRNPWELKRLESQNKSFIILLGHYNNFEWTSSLPLQGLSFKAYGVYKRIKNPYFNKFMCCSRARFNLHMLDKNKFVRQIIQDKRQGNLSAYIMVADQSPTLHEYNYWLPFFNREVPVHFGAEKMARRLNYAVSYLRIEKIRRGYYEAELISLTDEPATEPNGAIIRNYFQLLEKQIKSNPAYYWWTHKRWKHAKDNSVCEKDGQQPDAQTTEFQSHYISKFNNPTIFYRKPSWNK